MTMKHILVWIFIVGGFLSGVIWIVYGTKKLKNEESKFNLWLFVRKGFRSTRFGEFNGKEQISIGSLLILAALLLYILYSKVCPHWH